MRLSVDRNALGVVRDPPPVTDRLRATYCGLLVIQELESLKIIVLEGMGIRTNGDTNVNLTASFAEEEAIPLPGGITGKLWGSLGQGTKEELGEVFSYDYDYVLSRR